MSAESKWLRSAILKRLSCCKFSEIRILDKYLGLNVDTKPLLQQAEKFEVKLKELMSKGQKVSEEQKKKRLSYVG